MTQQDLYGLDMHCGDAAALPHYNQALKNLLLLRNDPVAAVDRATEVDPGLVMGHVLKGLLCVLGTEKSLLPDAAAALAAGRAVAGGASARERAHLDALQAWVGGRLNGACAHWEGILVAHPDDVLALFAAHQGDFFLGQSVELRDRVARRLPDIEPGSELHGHYLGMHAFGLEEMGDYARAEEAGRASVARNPQGAWAIHAVTHVMEMMNRIDDGIHWLGSRTADWAEDNFFAVHNWWHLALFHLDREHWDHVLKLYDERLRGSDSSVVLDMLDASALLWRLTLHGVDVGGRWQRLAALWEARIGDAWYAFNDCHAMMAFAGAGRADLAQALLKVMQQTAQQDGDNAAMTREVGLPQAQALLAFAQGEFARCVTLLTPVKSIAARAGGSHAQRDLIAQTLAAAAERAGQTGLARALLNERLTLKPQSVLNRQWMQRLRAGATA